MRAEEGGEKEVIKELLREYGSEAPFVVSDTSVLGGGREAHELKAFWRRRVIFLVAVVERSSGKFHAC